MAFAARSDGQRQESEKPIAPHYPNRYIVSVLIFDSVFERFKNFPEGRGQIMGFTPRGRRVASWAIVPMSIAALIFCATIRIGRSVHANQTATPSVRTIQLGAARPGALYALSLGVKDPAQLQGNDAVHVTVKDAQGEDESKWLHAGDLDFYLTLSPRSAGPVSVNLSSAPSVHVPEISASLNRILQSSATPSGKIQHLDRGVIRSEEHTSE